MKDETVLYATKEGELEIILSMKPDSFEDAKKWGTENGYGKFRIVKYSGLEKPDFTKTINK